MEKHQNSKFKVFLSHCFKKTLYKVKTFIYVKLKTRAIKEMGKKFSNSSAAREVSPFLLPIPAHSQKVVEPEGGTPQLTGRILSEKVALSQHV